MDIPNAKVKSPAFPKTSSPFSSILFGASTDGIVRAKAISLVRVDDLWRGPRAGRLGPMKRCEQ